MGNGRSGNEQRREMADLVEGEWSEWKISLRTEIDQAPSVKIREGAKMRRRRSHGVEMENLIRHNDPAGPVPNQSSPIKPLYQTG